MDLNDFTSAENKKVSSENDIPTFTPPAGDAPKVGVDGKSKKAPTFTPPTTSSMDPGCYYHPEERVVGHCARCGKNLCRYCCDSGLFCLYWKYCGFYLHRSDQIYRLFLPLCYYGVV